MKEKKELLRIKRHKRIRVRILGSQARPRLTVHRTLKNLSAQIIDDTKNITLFSLSTHDKEVKQKVAYAGNVKAAESFGEIFAMRAKEKGITRVVFDRAGYLYLGRVKTFAEALRKAGMEF